MATDWRQSVSCLPERHVADQYGHKLQDPSEDGASKGLSRMSVGVARSHYCKLATEGVTLSSGDIRSITAAYYRISPYSTEQYFYDAKINGLQYDRHTGEGGIELFTQSFMSAGGTFLSDPMESSFIPNRIRVHDAFHNICRQLL